MLNHDPDRELFTTDNPLQAIVDKCDQYMNESRICPDKCYQYMNELRICPEEVHAILNFIRVKAVELEKQI